MPNHIKNEVRISGAADKVMECYNAIIKPLEEKDYEGKTETRTRFSFEHVIPMPKTLNIESGSRTDEGIKLVSGTEKEREEVIARYKKWHSSDERLQAELDNLTELGKTAIENQKLYGHTTWYDWSIENWGTKWDAYDDDYDYNGGTDLYLHFNTAWSTPKPIFDKLAEMFPELSIYIEYADEDWGSNCGTITYENGEMTSWEDGDINFAMGLWGYTPEEIKEKMKEWEEWEKENEEDD